MQVGARVRYTKVPDGARAKAQDVVRAIADDMVHDMVPHRLGTYAACTRHAHGMHTACTRHVHPGPREPAALRR